MNYFRFKRSDEQSNKNDNFALPILFQQKIEIYINNNINRQHSELMRVKMAEFSKEAIKNPVLEFLNSKTKNNL